MTFHLEVTNRKLLLEKLTNHSSDLVIMGEPPADMSLITQPFMENPLIAIAHPDLGNLSIFSCLMMLFSSSSLTVCLDTKPIPSPA
jgi:DNA-binding transcriptional LysR family regulator